MATPDLSVFDRIRTKADYDREAEEFELKRLALTQAKAGNLPAALQIADRIKNLRAQKAAGNTNADQEISDIMDVQKVYKYEPGVYNQGGYVQAMPGYADAISGIEGAKSGSKQQAQKDVDLEMNPQIARGESDQRNISETNYAAGIAQNTATGRMAGENQGNINKRAVQSQDNISVIQEIRAPDETGRTLLDKATGSTIGAGVAGGKQFFGHSDESTQANAELTVYAGKLLNNVPRMEGPQSDADLKSYKEQAGKIGDPRIPAKDKEAALRAIQSLSEKYAAQNTSNVGVTQPPALDPRKIPMNAVRELKADPSGAAEFDAVFGEGAARMVLGGQ